MKYLSIKEILARLIKLKNDKYLNFNSKIIPTNQTMIGVKIPKLREIAKQIIKQDPIKFIKEDKQNIYELILLEGLVISYMKDSFKNLLPLFKTYLTKVDNWAQIDSIISSFKTIKKEQKFVLNIVKTWLLKNDEFIVRAGLVILLTYYIEKENLKIIFELSSTIKNNKYYVYMANAWLISSCMIKFPKETITFLEKRLLDKKTHNKAIQKSCDSYQVSKDYKIILKKMKIDS